ncbi:hypothetical protein VL15_03080 [Burkholderia cepacia]|uniref:Uncharacterized protein n=1 Tax=Burkholderia cepacia TaxID=292 RepID=A0A0J5XFH6_BURCE|nr:hypothetical protein VL15_03080 [Burkholderia cepacia]
MSALASGWSLESVRNFVGRDSIDTTSVYATAKLGRQYCEADTFLRLRLPMPASPPPAASGRE